MQHAADGRHGLVRQYAGAIATQKPVDQVSHGVFTYELLIANV
jgi:2-polyprenyl-6-methoxyphenol hydroxylase-like FAD-dependent oxidoreductase